MDEFLNFLFYALLGYAFSQILLGFVDSYLQEKIEVRNELIKKINDVVHAVTIEKHGDITYWFDADSDRFIAQGYTQDEIVQELKKRWPKHIFIISQSEMMIGPEFNVTPFTSKDLEALAK